LLVKLYIFVCLTQGLREGKYMWGVVKEQNGVLRSIFGQKRVATNRKMKKTIQLGASSLVLLSRER
jgi:hypothetical protein